jgi:hypothetical protein
MTRKQKDRQPSAHKDGRKFRAGGPTETVRRSQSRRCKPEALTSSQTSGAHLTFPLGGADIEELRSVTREWLVPRLVEKFLLVHGVELTHSRQRPNRLRLSYLGGSLGAVPKEIRSQAKEKT